YQVGRESLGVVSMCRRGRSTLPRRAMFGRGKWQVLRPRPSAILCIAVTAFGMVILPKLVDTPELGIVFYCIFFVNHWIVAIGLPTRVEAATAASRPWLHAWGFALGVLLLGGIGFVWSAPAWVWRAFGYTLPAHAP